MGGRAYVLGKVFQAFLTLVLILIFNFFLFRIIPADPVKLLVRSSGHNMTEAQQDRLRHDLGLRTPGLPRAVHRVPEGHGQAQPRTIAVRQPR